MPDSPASNQPSTTPTTAPTTTPLSTPTAPMGEVTTPPMPSTNTPPTPSISTDPGVVSSTTDSSFEPTGGNKPMKVVGLLVLAIVIIGGLAVGGYYLGINKILNPSTATPTPEATIEATPSPTPNPTADWKTYTETAQGIEFKYPDTWYAEPYKPLTFSVFLDDKPIKIPDASEFITPINVGYNEATVNNKKTYQEKTLAEGVVRYKALFDNSTVKVTEDLTIGGKRAAQISGKLGPGMLEGTYFEYTLVQMDGKLLVIQLYGDKHQSVYDQILTTFIFEETVSAPATKD